LIHHEAGLSFVAGHLRILLQMFFGKRGFESRRPTQTDEKIRFPPLEIGVIRALMAGRELSPGVDFVSNSAHSPETMMLASLCKNAGRLSSVL